MHVYESLDNLDEMLKAGQRTLLKNPDNLNTLLPLATAIANHAPKAIIQPRCWTRRDSMLGKLSTE
jgi:hypothetical protein